MTRRNFLAFTYAGKVSCTKLFGETFLVSVTLPIQRFLSKDVFSDTIWDKTVVENDTMQVCSLHRRKKSFMDETFWQDVLSNSGISNVSWASENNRWKKLFYRISVISILGIDLLVVCWLL